MDLAILTNTYSVVLLATASIFVIFILLLITGNHELRTRRYSHIAAWVLFLTLATTVSHNTSNIETLNWANKANHFFGGMVAGSFLLFAISYTEDARARIARALLITFQSTLAILYLFTDLIIKDSYFGPGAATSNGWHFGTLGFLFQLAYLGLFGIGFAILFKVRNTTHHPEEKAEINYIIGASAIGAIAPTTVGLILPMLGVFNYFWLTSTFGLVWLTSVMYVVIKHRTFKVRIILSELLLLILIFLAFINIFIPQS